MKTVALLLLTCACSSDRTASDKLPLAKRELPGISFDLPAGTEKTAELEYSAGRIARDVRGHVGFVHVRWSFGPDVGEDGLVLVRGVAKGLGTSADDAHVVPGGVPNTFALDKANHDLITLFRCGGRNIMLITTRTGEVLHARIGKTFDCHPDAAQETAATAIPIHIELPNFAVTQRSPGLVILDDGRSQITLSRQATGPVDDEQLERAAPEFLRGAGYDAPVVKRSGDLLMFTVMAQGEPRAGLIRIVRCPSFRAQIMVETDPALVAELETRARAARCLAAGEAAPQWPDAKP